MSFNASPDMFYCVGICGTPIGRRDPYFQSESVIQVNIRPDGGARFNDDVKFRNSSGIRMFERIDLRQ